MKSVQKPNLGKSGTITKNRPISGMMGNYEGKLPRKKFCILCNKEEADICTHCHINEVNKVRKGTW